MPAPLSGPGRADLHLGQGRTLRPDTLMQTAQIRAQKPLADGAGHTLIGRSDRLAVEDGGARAGLAAGAFAVGHDERVMDPVPDAVALPAAQIVIDRLPSGRTCGSATLHTSRNCVQSFLAKSIYLRLGSTNQRCNLDLPTINRSPPIFILTLALLRCWRRPTTIWPTRLRLGSRSPSGERS